MTPAQHFRFWFGAAAVFFVLLWLFRDVLAPFVAALLIAWLLNPAVAGLSRRGVSRGLAAAAVLLLFLALAGAALAVLVPAVQAQLSDALTALPGWIERAQLHLQPRLESLYQSLSPEQTEKLRAAAGSWAGEAVGWTAGLAKGLWKGGAAFFDVVAFLVILPVVSFYLLRDWDRLCKSVDRLLPQREAPVIRSLLKEMDATISAFLRGQSTVCLTLGLFYGLGLFFLGLDFGLLIGILSGVLSFIPYVGSIAGFITGVSVAWLQTGGWELPALVAGVFMFGQLIEGNVLTPNLVGDKVGLHAVWVLFALMAGGNLLGFTGVMLAVPVAAIIGVMTRFFVRKYQDSPYYRDSGKASKAGK